MAITLKQLNTLLDSINLKVSKGTKIGKAVKSSFFNVFGVKPVSDEWTNGVKLEVFVALLEGLTFCVSKEEINEAYAYVGSSCMKGKPVGEFYELVGLQCVIIDGARGLIDPVGKSFVVCYGPNHYVLRSILLLLGYKQCEFWSDAVDKKMAEVRGSTYISGSEIPKFLKYVASLITAKQYDEIMEHLGFQEWDEGDGKPYSAWLQEIVENYHIGKRMGADGGQVYYSVMEIDGYTRFNNSCFIPYVDGNDSFEEKD